MAFRNLFECFLEKCRNEAEMFGMYGTYRHFYSFLSCIFCLFVTLGLFSLSAVFPKMNPSCFVHFGLFFVRVFGTSMVEEYDEIADSQYPSERVEYLDEDYGV